MCVRERETRQFLLFLSSRFCVLCAVGRSSSSWRHLATRRTFSSYLPVSMFLRPWRPDANKHFVAGTQINIILRRGKVTRFISCYSSKFYVYDGRRAAIAKYLLFIYIDSSRLSFSYVSEVEVFDVRVKFVNGVLYIHDSSEFVYPFLVGKSFRNPAVYSTAEKKVRRVGKSLKEISLVGAKRV